MNEPEQRPGELRLRQAEIVDVSFPERMIDLIVIPYETEALVPHPRERRMVTEIISRGAFDGIQERDGAVKVNRDHDVKRTVGRAMSFNPSRADGLFARLRISRTDIGEETLVLAEDGCLDASAGFYPLTDKHGRIKPGAEVWETRNRCRIGAAYLRHIALTPEPAYADAKVLAVRSEPEPLPEPAGTPNLAALQIAEWAAKLDELDRRYRVTG